MARTAAPAEAAVCSSSLMDDGCLGEDNDEQKEKDDDDDGLNKTACKQQEISGRQETVAFFS